MKNLFIALSFMLLISFSSVFGYDFVGPQSVVQALKTSFPELVNPNCFAFHVRKSEDLDLYFASGYSISEIHTEIVDLTPPVQAMKVTMRLKNAIDLSEQNAIFLCRMK